MENKKIIKAILSGLGAGIFGYIIGGIAAPYLTAVTSEAVAAAGFVLTAAYKLAE